MEKSIASILSRNFQSFTETKDIPNEPGVFVLANCPLIETNPSKWLGSVIESGVSETSMRENIKTIVATNRLATKYEDLTYLVLIEKSQGRRQDVLLEINQVRKLDK